MKVYVAAPFEDAATVREIHNQLRILGIQPTSSWADVSNGPEALANYSRAELQDFALRNDDDLLGADAVIVLARPGVGGEMFAEARLAIVHDIPVYWIGRRILSSYRSGVHVCENLEEVLYLLSGS